MTNYRAFTSVNGPSAATSYSGSFGPGVKFKVTAGSLYLAGFWWWVCSTGGQSTSAQPFCLWQVYGSSAGIYVPGTEVTSGTLSAGWNYVAYTTAIPISAGVTYQAATAFSGPFPLTSSEFASGGTYAAGIVNGPLTVYSDGTGTNPDPWSNSQYTYQQTTATDPTSVFAADADAGWNGWLDVQVTDAPPSGATSRLWPNYPRLPVGINSQTNAYNLATEFSASSAQTLEKIWFYSPPTATVLPSKCGIWNVSTQAVVSGSENDTPTWSGAAGSGWVSCAYISGPTLSASQDYKVAVYYTGGAEWFVADTGYWESGGPGVSGISNNAITAPNESGATPGQSSYASTWAYPSTDGAGENYFIDVELSAASTGETVTGVIAASASAAPAGIPAIAVTGPAATGSGTAPAGGTSPKIPGTTAASASTAPAGTPGIAVPGPAAASSGAAPPGTVTGTGTVTGVIAASAAASPAGTATGTATVTGTTAASASTAPAGAPGPQVPGTVAAAASTALAGVLSVTVTGTVATSMSAALAGTVTAAGTVTGTIAAAVSAAPPGAATAAVTVTGPVAASAAASLPGIVTIAVTAAAAAGSCAAPPGTVTGTATVTGAIAAASSAAPPGSAATGNGVTGTVAAASAASPAGGISVLVPGAPAATASAAPSGTVQAGVHGSVAACAAAAAPGTVSWTVTVTGTTTAASTSAAPAGAVTVPGITTITGVIAASASTAPAGAAQTGWTVPGTCAAGTGRAFPGIPGTGALIAGPAAASSGQACAGFLPVTGTAARCVSAAPPGAVYTRSPRDITVHAALLEPAGDSISMTMTLGKG